MLVTLGEDAPTGPAAIILVLRFIQVDYSSLADLHNQSIAERLSYALFASFTA
jgi:hypothetical protein